MIDAVSARCETAAEKARTALDPGTLPDFHAMMASIALVMALGARGEDDDSPASPSGRSPATTSFQASHMRFWFGSVYARACRLTGRIDECVRSAKRLADSARDIPGLAYADLAYLSATPISSAATSQRGEASPRGARRSRKERRNNGFTTASCFALAEAHAKLGQPAAAMGPHRGPAMRSPRLPVHADRPVLATGWTLAAGGSLAEAITVVQEAAAEARDRAQPTHELACLQAAIQFGEPRGGART